MAITVCVCVCVCVCVGGVGGSFKSQLNELQMWNEHTCNSHLRQNYRPEISFAEMVVPESKFQGD